MSDTAIGAQPVSVKNKYRNEGAEPTETLDGKAIAAFCPKPLAAIETRCFETQQLAFSQLLKFSLREQGAGHLVPGRRAAVQDPRSVFIMQKGSQGSLTLPGQKAVVPPGRALVRKIKKKEQEKRKQKANANRP